jgi:hypothetical protein
MGTLVGGKQIRNQMVHFHTEITTIVTQTIKHRCMVVKINQPMISR